MDEFLVAVSCRVLVVIGGVLGDHLRRAVVLADGGTWIWAIVGSLILLGGYRLIAGRRAGRSALH